MVKTLIKANERNVQPLKHANLFIMVILTFLTMGSYIGIWFLKRRNDIVDLSPTTRIHFGWWRFFTVGLFVFFFLRIFGSIAITEFGMDFIESLDVIFAFFFISLLYFSIYRLKELLESTKMIDMNTYLLFFLHIFYIQYKVNQESLTKK